jgi:hypothetical protein
VTAAAPGGVHEGVKRSLLVFALVVAGCGAEERPPQPSAMGPGLSVAEALESDLQGPLLVSGVLVERDGKLRLCSAILESHPPQCGEPSLAIEGEVEDEAGDHVKLLGEVEDGTIRLSGTATA